MTINDEHFRERVIEVLELLADGAAQADYQARAPHVRVGNELFNQWEDAYSARAAVLAGFTAREREALERFHAVFERVADASPKDIELVDFMRTEEWRQLRSAAARARADLVDRRPPEGGPS